MSGNRTPAGRTAITKISHLPGKFLTPPPRRALSQRAQLGPKRIAYGMPEKRNFSCRITPRRKEEGGNVEGVCAAKGRCGETAAAYVASSFEDSSTSSSLRVPTVHPTPNIVVSVRVIPEMAETENNKCRKSGDSEIQGAVQLGHPRM
ncbi:hypothetical protein ALC53_01972 [Atta colombica]|uniref:Uncharacterized protein n=1 Tax=Atta colombica TaxID=520822 RepID=A0A195BRM1_9HYME|nr:hypothetical protein ALC53_01972 [Atta colombica]